MLGRFSDALKLFVWSISLGKTEVLHQLVPNTNPRAPNVVIESAKLANVDQFKCLGSTISEAGSVDIIYIEKSKT